jgi:hypothetical protein
VENKESKDLRVSKEREDHRVLKERLVLKAR